jgi:hypothetical protein
LIARVIVRGVRHASHEWAISKIDDVYRQQVHRIKRATAAELQIFDDLTSKMLQLRRSTVREIKRGTAPRQVLIELYVERLEALLTAVRETDRANRRTA